MKLSSSAFRRTILFFSLTTIISNTNLKNYFFLNSAEAASSRSQKSEIKSEPQTSITDSITSIPSDSLIVPEDSPFSKLYLKGLEDPNINKNAIRKAFEFLIQNKDELKKEGLCLLKDNTANTKKIRNLNCLVIADYTKSKLEQRLHVFKFDENKIYSLLTAHGKGSNEVEKSKMATKFSNISGSLQTSLGFYLTDHPYSSSKITFGPGPNNGIKLDGLQCSNNNAKKRYIVMHTAKYVPDTINGEASIDYSEGCITFSPSQQKLMLTCAHGALLYNHAE